MAVMILAGSASDVEVMGETAKTLAAFGVPHELTLASAHRSPDRVRELVLAAPGRGVKVFIVGAGAAAHLAGVVAAHTTCPVIGVPLEGSALHGLDALLATVQMPAGVPVATVAIGKAGAVNAALLAVQILAVSDAGLAGRLAKHRQELAATIEDGARSLTRDR